MRQDGNIYYVNFYRGKKKNYPYKYEMILAGIATASIACMPFSQANWNRFKQYGLENAVARLNSKKAGELENDADKA